MQANAQDDSVAGELTGTVHKVSVDIGVAIDDRIQVRGDIQADDLVVVVGNERLTPNSQVTIIRQQEATGN